MGDLVRQRSKLDSGLARVPNVLGFAAHWAWIWCVFWSSLFYRESSLFVNLQWDWLSLEPLWTISLFSNVVALASLLILAYRRNPLSDIRILPPFAAAATALGTVLISHSSVVFFGTMAQYFYTVGAFLTGIGSAAVVVLWGELFTTIGARQTISYSVMALLMGALAYLLITAIPATFAQMVTAALPLASIFFLLRFRRGIPRKEYRTGGAGCRQKHTALCIKTPFKLIGISLFFGISFGVMKGFFGVDEGEIIELRNLLNILAIVVGSSAIYATMKIFRMDFNHLTYQVALPLMAAGFIFLPLHSPFDIIGTAVHQAGYQYFYIVLWALWPVLARRGDVPEGWLVCWGILSIQLGQLLGSISSANLINFIDTVFELAMASAVVIFIILLIALFALGNSSINTGWGFIKPIEETDHVSDFERACMQMSQSRGLSPRETEVFLLLAKGHNRAHISADLVVSDETVKSHIKSIYRKMEVHSQQEIITVIEQEEKGIV
jgi:DNA-binding CsgD family transcriptional regulator